MSLPENGFRVADFDFDLPEELIAQHPPAERGQSRMLVMNRANGDLRDTHFSEFPALLQPGDLLVLNDSRVIAARLYAKRAKVQDRQNAGGQSPSGMVEVLLTEPADDGTWKALVKPGRKVGIGDRLNFPTASGRVALEAEVIERGRFGERLLRFAPVDDFYAVLDQIGHIPLPPYIRRDDAMEDRKRYQTVFAFERGSVAAPTAGLHFTNFVLEAIAAKGVEIAYVTLHVGMGTFAPLRVQRVDEVRLHCESYSIPKATAEAVNQAKRDGRRIIAVGTTVVRTLEAAAFETDGGSLKPHTGKTSIFIQPGFQFRIVNALLTNFHLPKSSLLILVSAFASREYVLSAYTHAVVKSYRFFSYGDCMFLT
jgi:S-adenosylmethionine:tRNA ribosyltransferase-isomerase